MKNINIKIFFSKSNVVAYSLFFLLFALVPIAKGCVTPDPGGLPHFKKGNKVYYHFANNIPVNSAEMNQIKTAFNNLEYC